MTDAELDRLVAERIMGWPDQAMPFHPSSQIKDAWQVVEKMENDGWWWAVSSRNLLMSDLKELPFAEFWHYANGEMDKRGEGECDSIPRAICLAALAALGVPVDGTAANKGEG